MALHPPWLFLKSKVMDFFEPLDPDDVVVVEGELVINQSTFQVHEFMNEIHNALADYAGSYEQRRGLLNEGTFCKVLRPNEGWQQGRLRLRLEFCPDQSGTKKVVDAPDLLGEFR